MLSHVQFSVTSWMVARQGPLSMGFSRQEYWEWVAVPSSRRSSRPRVKPESPGSSALQADSLPTEPSRKPTFFSTIELLGYFGILVILSLSSSETSTGSKLTENLMTTLSFGVQDTVQAVTFTISRSFFSLFFFF